MQQYKKIKSSCPRDITPKQLRSGEAHLRTLATQLLTFDNFMFDLTAHANKSQTYRMDSDVVTTDLSGRSQNSHYNR